MGLQTAVQLRGDVLHIIIEQAAVRLHHHDPAALLLRDAAQKQVLLPQLAEPCADVHRLIDGAVQAFDAGGDQEGVKAHLPGNGVGDHITDHHPVAALLEPLQGVAHLLGTADGEDVQIKVQQAAKGVGGFGDAGKAHDGVQAGVVLCQFHGAQHIIHRDMDIHHRQVGHLPDQGGGAAAGDDAVVAVGRHALHDGLSLFQIAGVHLQLNVGVGLRRLLHGGAHSVVGGNAQNAGVSLDHKTSLRVSL